LELEELDRWIYPIDSKPYGSTYSEWTVKWWRWLLEIPKLSSPAFDRVGIRAATNQKNPKVYFLCQTCDKAGSVPNRRITLPDDCSIFMPIINWISFPDDDKDPEELLVANAKERMDVIGDLRISISGKKIKEKLIDYRVTSSVFVCKLPKDNLFGLPSGNTRAFSDGYWIFLKPLQSDSKLSTFGSCSSGATRISVGYYIKVQKT
jgi:hypothetical protein